MIPVTYPSNENGSMIVGVVETTGLRAWVDYIPVVIVEVTDLNRHDDDSAKVISTLEDLTGLRAWEDYIPIAEVSEDITKQWTSDDAGYIPVIEED